MFFDKLDFLLIMHFFEIKSLNDFGKRKSMDIWKSWMEIQLFFTASEILDNDNFDDNSLQIPIVVLMPIVPTQIGITLDVECSQPVPSLYQIIKT